MAIKDLFTREHFTNGRSLALGTGIAMISLGFGAYTGCWHHYITIGMLYGSGGVMVIASLIVILKSYYAPEQGPDPNLRIQALLPIVGVQDGLQWTEQQPGKQLSVAFINNAPQFRGRPAAPANELAASLEFFSASESLYIQRAYWMDEVVSQVNIPIGVTKRLVVGSAEGDKWLVYENVHTEIPQYINKDGLTVHYGGFPRRLSLSTSLEVTIRVYSQLTGKVLDSATFPLGTHNELVNRKEVPSWWNRITKKVRKP